MLVEDLLARLSVVPNGLVDTKCHKGLQFVKGGMEGVSLYELLPTILLHCFG